MRKSLMILLALAPATPLAAAGNVLSIGSARFSQAEIIDARAQPQLDGKMAILLSFDETSTARLTKATADQAGKALVVQWNGKQLCAPTILASPTDGAFLLDCFPKQSFEEAAALARAISGKDPLPETLEDEP